VSGFTFLWNSHRHQPLIAMKYTVICMAQYIVQEGWLSPTERASISAYFGLAWHVPGTNNRGKCHMDERWIQCLSNALQHVLIYLQPFPSNSTRKFKSSPFFAHFGLPWVRPWDNRGKCYMDGKRIQCWSNAYHKPIYLQPFTSYFIAIYW